MQCEQDKLILKPPAERDLAAAMITRADADGLPDGPVPFHYPAPDYIKDLLAP